MTNIKERLRSRVCRVEHEWIWCWINEKEDKTIPEEMAKAADRIEELETETEHQFDEISRLDKEIDRLRRDAEPGDGQWRMAVAEERERLRPWLHHKGSCQFHGKGNEFGPCDCGLEKALKDD